LFGKFYQLQNAGITGRRFWYRALYLVKAFIENHKGSITYQSEAGKGTVFNVSLLKGKEHFGTAVYF
jgi:K+-sensing histidine kinase KdpD